jgi:uncharacterized membrane protein YfhO
MKNPQNKKVVTPEKPTKKKEYVDVFENMIKNKSLYFLFVPVAFLLLFVYRDFISGRNFLMFHDIGSDTITLTYPHLVCVSEYIHRLGIPSWSFQQGLGQNLYPLTISDPFTLSLYLVGKDHIASFIVYTELTKIVLIAYFAFLFFKKINLSRYVSIIGAMMIAFSGFVVLGGTWYEFSTEALYFTILMYGIECVYQNKKWFVFSLGVFLTAVIQPVLLFTFVCFLFLYLLVRVLSEDKVTPAFIGTKIGAFIGLGIIGLGLSAVFSLPTIDLYMHSPRVAGNVSLFQKLISFGMNFESKQFYGTALMRLFSSDMLGSGSTFTGWSNYLEAPLFYCGLPLILLVPQVFNGISTKMKIVYGSLIAFLILTVLFPFIRYSFWLFSGDYFRFYSFGLVFLLLIMGLHALHTMVKSGNVNLITLGVSTVVVLYVLKSAKSFDLEVIEATNKAAMVFIVLYAGYIALFKYEKFRLAGQILLFSTLIIELGYMSSKTINDRIVIKSSEFKEKIGYNDYTVDALKYVKEKDKSFYRISKNYLPEVAIHMALNDAKILNYYGGTNYISFNQLQYVNFFQETEAIKNESETDSRWCIGYLNRPLLQLLCNVKYVITKGQVDPMTRMMNDSLATFQDVTVRKAKYAMPLGTTYDTYITKDEFKKLQPICKDIALLKSFVVDSKIPVNTAGLKQITSKDVSMNYNFDMLQQDVSARKTDSLHITLFQESHIKGDITVSAKKLLFLAIPNDQGWQAVVDGKAQKPTTISAGMMGFMLDKGKHTIELEFVRPYFKLGAIVSVCTLVVFLGLILFFELRKRKTV